jgi:hypothetical protein
MKNYINFIIGLFSPELVINLFPPDYFIFEKLIDFCSLVLASTITGCLVAWFGHWIDSLYKRHTKRHYNK